MFYLVDQYDSFVYNLSAYLRQAGEQVVVRRADRVTLSEIAALRPAGILLSPGPKRPEDAKEAHRVLEAFQGEIPILGVCLGHQVICRFYGGTVSRGSRPMHGKVTPITHDGTGVFADLPERFSVTRYHSLAAEPDSLPAVLRVTAWSDDGVIMGVAHGAMPVYGVQFHPEAVLTQQGHPLLRNFIRICKEWRAQP